MTTEKMTDVAAAIVSLGEPSETDEAKAGSNPSVSLQTYQRGSHADIDRYYINYIDDSSPQSDPTPSTMNTLADEGKENSSRLEVTQLPDEVVLTVAS